MGLSWGWQRHLGQLLSQLQSHRAVFSSNVHYSSGGLGFMISNHCHTHPQAKLISAARSHFQPWALQLNERSPRNHACKIPRSADGRTGQGPPSVVVLNQDLKCDFP